MMTSNVTIAANEWSHIAVTVDRNEIIQFYINGTIAGTYVDEKNGLTNKFVASTNCSTNDTWWWHNATDDTEGRWDKGVWYPPTEGVNITNVAAGATDALRAMNKTNCSANYATLPAGVTMATAPVTIQDGKRTGTNCTTDGTWWWWNATAGGANATNVAADATDALKVRNVTNW
jgi:hypothetical protein